MLNPTHPVSAPLTVETAMRRAYAHWRAGQAAQAEQLCLRILRVSPQQPGAVHLLGIMAHAYGLQERAIGYLEAATRMPRAPAVLHSNLAEMYRQKGLLREAEQSARKAVAADPQLMDAWNNLGIIAQECGKLTFSETCLRNVLAVRPTSPQAHNNLANTLRRLGDSPQALHHYQQALEHDPHFVQACINQSSLLRELGQMERATELAEQAIAIAPRCAEAYLNLADLATARQRPEEAARWLDALRAFAPDRVNAQGATSGTALSAEEIAACHQQVLELSAQGCHAEVEALLTQTLAKGNGPPTLWHLLARALRAQLKMEPALRIMAMLVRVRPGEMTARFDLASLLLVTGNFSHGWREYRFRYQMEHTAKVCRHVQKPRWEGQKLAGKCLLIHDEQGFGDTFQFLRLVKIARERSEARIILQVNKECLALARRCEGWDTIVVRESLPPPFDYHCELMSLPMALGLQLADLPGTVPYLFADPQRIAAWQQRLAHLPRPLVGLVWAGRPEHNNDKNRSMTLNDLAPLAQPGVSFLALQKGVAASQAATPPAGMDLLSLSDEIVDFDDTAAILCIIDVLISVDSSPVHLAGALGRPAWVMLPYEPEWRWLLSRDDSPWYPSLTLFRQPQHEHWAPVVQAMAQRLKQWPWHQPC